MNSVLATIDEDGKKYFHRKEVRLWIDRNWARLWTRPKNVAWAGPVTACLAMTTARFTSLDENLFGLIELKAIEEYSDLNGCERVISADILPDGILSPHIKGAKKKGMSASSSVSNLFVEPLMLDVFEGITEAEADTQASARYAMMESSSVALRKKRRFFKYDDENFDHDDQNFLSIFPDLDNANDEPVVISTSPTHTAPQVKVFNDGLTLTNEKGYRMAKASHGVWEGHYYYEVTLNNDKGAARIGWSQISGDLQAACGYDIFSYSFRSGPGTLFHNSRAQKEVEVQFEGGYSTYFLLIPRKRRCAGCINLYSKEKARN
jgi:hypothetical protein